MRGALLVGVGIAGGIALGLALSALVVGLVQVAARVETPIRRWSARCRGSPSRPVRSRSPCSPRPPWSSVVRRGFAEDVPRHGAGELA